MIDVERDQMIESHNNYIILMLDDSQVSCPHKSVPAIPSLNSSKDILPSWSKSHSLIHSSICDLKRNIVIW